MKRTIAIVVLLASFGLLSACNEKSGKNENNANIDTQVVKSEETISVTEPAPLALIGLGLAGILIMRRFKK